MQGLLVNELADGRLKLPKCIAKSYLGVDALRHFLLLYIALAFGGEHLLCMHKLSGSIPGAVLEKILCCEMA